MAYVGKHRKPRPHRHQRVIDHVEDAWPCVKTRLALAGFVILLAVVCSFGVTVAPPDPTELGQVAFVSADVPVYGPALMTGACFR
jgi:hypothetical protein